MRDGCVVLVLKEVACLKPCLCGTWWSEDIVVSIIIIDYQPFLIFTQPPMDLIVSKSTIYSPILFGKNATCASENWLPQEGSLLLDSIPVGICGHYMFQTCEGRLDGNMGVWKPKREPCVILYMCEYSRYQDSSGMRETTLRCVPNVPWRGYPEPGCSSAAGLGRQRNALQNWH